MSTKPTDEIDDPLVGSKSESSIQQDLAKSPQDPTQKKGRVLLVGAMLAFIACSSFGILCHHSYHDAGVKEAVISETTEGVVNEMSEMTDDDLESEVSVNVFQRTLLKLVYAQQNLFLTLLFFNLYHKSVLGLQERF